MTPVQAEAFSKTSTRLRDYSGHVTQIKLHNGGPAPPDLTECTSLASPSTETKTAWHRQTGTAHK
jgi:hypothetical protein